MRELTANEIEYVTGGLAPVAAAAAIGCAAGAVGGVVAYMGAQAVTSNGNGASAGGLITSSLGGCVIGATGAIGVIGGLVAAGITAASGVAAAAFDKANGGDTAAQQREQIYHDSQNKGPAPGPTSDASDSLGDSSQQYADNSGYSDFGGDSGYSDFGGGGGGGGGGGWRDEGEYVEAC